MIKSVSWKETAVPMSPQLELVAGSTNYTFDKPKMISFPDSLSQ